jgi:inositol-phosphate phosphatase/L-galactose 1-phosphate phosphatase/histidinol-phosphatase
VGLLASGHVDLIVEAGLKLWDFAALVPVVENAGGIITDWRGAALTTASDGTFVAAGSAALHDAALELLAGSR